MAKVSVVARSIILNQSPAVCHDIRIGLLIGGLAFVQVWTVPYSRGKHDLLEEPSNMSKGVFLVTNGVWYQLGTSATSQTAEPPTVESVVFGAQAFLQKRICIRSCLLQQMEMISDMMGSAVPVDGDALGMAARGAAAADLNIQVLERLSTMMITLLIHLPGR